MALRSISYLVFDDDLACEDSLIRLPVLQHLHIDSKTLLEANRRALHCTDCSDVGIPTTNCRGHGRRLIIAKTLKVKEVSYEPGTE